MSPLRSEFLRRRTLLREAAIALALAVCTAAGGARPGARALTVAIGAVTTRRTAAGPGARRLRVDLDPQASRDDRLTFYFRPLRDGAVLRLPVVPRGPMRVAFRARAMVRSIAGRVRARASR